MITKDKSNQTVLNFLEKHNLSYVKVKGDNAVVVENVLILRLKLSTYKTKSVSTMRYAVSYFNNPTIYRMKRETLLQRINELVAEEKEFINK
jgi:hypothetical protein